MQRGGAWERIVLRRSLWVWCQIVGIRGSSRYNAIIFQDSRRNTPSELIHLLIEMSASAKKNCAVRYCLTDEDEL